MPLSTLAGIPRALRLARAWAGAPPVSEAAPGTTPEGREIIEERAIVPSPAGDAPLSVLRIRPSLRPPRRGPAPAWLLLHGITILGFEHRSLLRFARGLAATGAHVLVPEIPPWTRLELAPNEARRILRDGIRVLIRDPEVLSGRIGLAGFSFGGPQVLLAAGDPEFAGEIRAVLAWGSYARLEPTIRFGFTGRHRSSGGEERLIPDPYGRWILGMNLLPRVPIGRDHAGTVAALTKLARAWASETIDPFGPAFGALRAELRGGLPVGERPLYDLFVPPDGVLPDPTDVDDLVTMLTETATRELPLLDPLAPPPTIRASVHLVHGRRDILIPWSETERLGALLRPTGARLHTTITGIFAHSQEGAGDGRRAPAPRFGDRARFLAAIARLLGENR